jgi:hypothetical protein
MTGNTSPTPGRTEALVRTGVRIVGSKGAPAPSIRAPPAAAVAPRVTTSETESSTRRFPSNGAQNGGDLDLVGAPKPSHFCEDRNPHKVSKPLHTHLPAELLSGGLSRGSCRCCLHAQGWLIPNHPGFRSDSVTRIQSCRSRSLRTEPVRSPPCLRLRSSIKAEG